MLARSLSRFFLAHTPSIKFLGKRSQLHKQPATNGKTSQNSQPHSTSKLDLSKLQAFGSPLNAPALNEKQISCINEGGAFQLDYKKVKPIALKK